MKGINNLNYRSFEDAKRFLTLVLEEHGLIPEACYLIANKVDLN